MEKKEDDRRREAIEGTRKEYIWGRLRRAFPEPTMLEGIVKRFGGDLESLSLLASMGETTGNFKPPSVGDWKHQGAIGAPEHLIQVVLDGESTAAQVLWSHNLERNPLGEQVLGRIPEERAPPKEFLLPAAAAGTSIYLSEKRMEKAYRNPDQRKPSAFTGAPTGNKACYPFAEGRVASSGLGFQTLVEGMAPRLSGSRNLKERASQAYDAMVVAARYRGFAVYLDGLDGGLTFLGDVAVSIACLYEQTLMRACSAFLVQPCSPWSDTDSGVDISESSLGYVMAVYVNKADLVNRLTTMMTLVPTAARSSLTRVRKALLGLTASWSTSRRFVTAVSQVPKIEPGVRTTRLGTVAKAHGMDIPGMRTSLFRATILNALFSQIGNHFQESTGRRSSPCMTVVGHMTYMTALFYLDKSPLADLNKAAAMLCYRTGDSYDIGRAANDDDSDLTAIGEAIKAVYTAPDENLADIVEFAREIPEVCLPSLMTVRVPHPSKPDEGVTMACAFDRSVWGRASIERHELLGGRHPTGDTPVKFDVQGAIRDEQVAFASEMFRKFRHKWSSEGRSLTEIPIYVGSSGSTGASRKFGGAGWAVEMMIRDAMAILERVVSEKSAGQAPIDGQELMRIMVGKNLEGMSRLVKEFNEANRLMDSSDPVKILAGEKLRRGLVMPELIATRWMRNYEEYVTELCMDEVYGEEWREYCTRTPVPNNVTEVQASNGNNKNRVFSQNPMGMMIPGERLFRTIGPYIYDDKHRTVLTPDPGVVAGLILKVLPEGGAHDAAVRRTGAFLGTDATQATDCADIRLVTPVFERYIDAIEAEFPEFFGPEESSFGEFDGLSQRNLVVSTVRDGCDDLVRPNLMAAVTDLPPRATSGDPKAYTPPGWPANHYECDQIDAEDERFESCIEPMREMLESTLTFFVARDPPVPLEGISVEADDLRKVFECTHAEALSASRALAEGLPVAIGGPPGSGKTSGVIKLSGVLNVQTTITQPTIQGVLGAVGRATSIVLGKARTPEKQEAINQRIAASLGLEEEYDREELTRSQAFQIAARFGGGQLNACGGAGTSDYVKRMPFDNAWLRFCTRAYIPSVEGLVCIDEFRDDTCALARSLQRPSGLLFSNADENSATITGTFGEFPTINVGSGGPPVSITWNEQTTADLALEQLVKLFKSENGGRHIITVTGGAGGFEIHDIPAIARLVSKHIGAAESADSGDFSPSVTLVQGLTLNQVNKLQMDKPADLHYLILTGRSTTEQRESAQSGDFYVPGKINVILSTSTADRAVTLPRIGATVDTGTVITSVMDCRDGSVGLAPMEETEDHRRQRALRGGRIKGGVRITHGGETVIGTGSLAFVIRPRSTRLPSTKSVIWDPTDDVLTLLTAGLTYSACPLQVNPANGRQAVVEAENILSLLRAGGKRVGGSPEVRGLLALQVPLLAGMAVLSEVGFPGNLMGVPSNGSKAEIKSARQLDTTGLAAIAEAYREGLIHGCRAAIAFAETMRGRAGSTWAHLYDALMLSAKRLGAEGAIADLRVRAYDLTPSERAALSVLYRPWSGRVQKDGGFVCDARPDLPSTIFDGPTGCARPKPGTFIVTCRPVRTGEHLGYFPWWFEHVPESEVVPSLRGVPGTSSTTTWITCGRKGSGRKPVWTMQVGACHCPNVSTTVQERQSRRADFIRAVVAGSAVPDGEHAGKPMVTEEGGGISMAQRCASSALLVLTSLADGRSFVDQVRRDVDFFDKCCNGKIYRVREESGVDDKEFQRIMEESVDGKEGDRESAELFGDDLGKGASALDDLGEAGRMGLVRSWSLLAGSVGSRAVVGLKENEGKTHLVILDQQSQGQPVSVTIEFTKVAGTVSLGSAEVVPSQPYRPMQHIKGIPNVDQIVPIPSVSSGIGGPLEKNFETRGLAEYGTLFFTEGYPIKIPEHATYVPFESVASMSQTTSGGGASNVADVLRKIAEDEGFLDPSGAVDKDARGNLLGALSRAVVSNRGSGTLKTASRVMAEASEGIRPSIRHRRVLEAVASVMESSRGGGADK